MAAAGWRYVGEELAATAGHETGEGLSLSADLGCGQDKHENHSGPTSPCVEAPRPSLAAESGRQRDCLFSEAVDQVFRGRKLRIL